MTLAQLLLLAARAVDGAGLGRHPLRRRGRAQTFREHRAYQPGDDLRHVDWHALARHDALFTKVFEDEAPIRIEMVLDLSGSMATERKADTAQILLCALAQLALSAGEEVGLQIAAVGARHGIVKRISAAGGLGHLPAIAQAVQSTPARGETPLAEALWTTAHTLKRRSHVFILSDFWLPLAPLSLGLQKLQSQRHDVTVVCLRSANEQTLPGVGPTLYLDTEGDAAIHADAGQLQQPYAAALQAHDTALRQKCRQFTAAYVLAHTHKSATQLLTDILTATRPKRHVAGARGA
jgi:uncharacterized protein (DUF58 family)